jgi:hypothetical protein
MFYTDQSIKVFVVPSIDISMSAVVESTTIVSVVLIKWGLWELLWY